MNDLGPLVGIDVGSATVAVVVGQVKLERYGAEFLDAIALGTSEAVD